MLRPTKSNKTQRRRYVEPNNVRTLSVSGHEARETYILETLKALARHGTLRAQGVAKAVFPTREGVAGVSAAQRVLRACLQRKLVEGKRNPGTQHVYYALTVRGAELLNERDPMQVPAQSTAHLLKGEMLKAEHREWTAAIVTAASCRAALTSYGELEIQRNPQLVSKTLLDERFRGQHVPDALTFYADDRKVVWHEVELSRRNHWSASVIERKQREENARAKQRGSVPRKVRSGRQNFVHLLRTIRTARVLVHKGKEHDIVLVVHCATPLIRQELSRLVEEAYMADALETFPARLAVLEEGRHYRVNWNASGLQTFLEVWLQDLPAKEPSAVSVYDNELLWPDAPHEVREPEVSERFIARD